MGRNGRRKRLHGGQKRFMKEKQRNEKKEKDFRSVS